MEMKLNYAAMTRNVMISLSISTVVFYWTTVAWATPLTVKEDRQYRPVWKDLDTRPPPEWYDHAKIGVFLHWGVYSVPAFGSEWFWQYWRSGAQGPQYKDFMKKNYPPGFTYQEFAPRFTAHNFDPVAWANLFKSSGMKYVVLTSKHHDGYALFPSKRSFSWNSVEVGPHRDIVRELSDAVRKAGLEFGVYYSLYEWYNPLYLSDKGNHYETCVYRDQKVWPDLMQLIQDYKPSVLWSDGDWEAKDSYWNSTYFLAWLYSKSPVRHNIVTNDRWGSNNIKGKHGDFFNFDDRYNRRRLESHKWENALTLDTKSWGYRKEMPLSNVMTMEALLEQVVSTVSCGGNILINIGPTKEGIIVPIFQERLLSLGAWLKVNGEAIYGTSPWMHQRDTLEPSVWYTCVNTRYNPAKPSAATITQTVSAIYAIFLKWPKSNVLHLSAFDTQYPFIVELLDTDTKHTVAWSVKKGYGEIKLPDKASVKSSYAWVLKFHPGREDIHSNHL